MAMQNRFYVFGNWKMNPVSQEQAKAIATKVRNFSDKLEKTEVIVCPPFPFIASVKSRELPKNYHIGAQSVSSSVVPSSTGAVSALMLKDMGVEYVIVGHSEERTRGETDDVISTKMNIVLENDLTPVLCVGEKERDESGHYLDFIKNQINSALSKVSKSSAKDIIIAYEPIYAIGASLPVSNEQIHEMNIFIRKVFGDMFGVQSAMKLIVLYGGSVNASNSAEIITGGKVDGLLVGRESLDPINFIELLKQVDATNRI